MHIIHRGIVNKSYKENCLKSFRASFKKRFGIETDIHSTKDKKFVCFHDFTLERIFKIKSKNGKNYYDILDLMKKNMENNKKIKSKIEIKKFFKNYKRFYRLNAY